ncbi:MAG TPA: GTP 3',8-cyclase MoaA [Fimbriimonadaceae bacterium]|nr:GTP 3',8-cyclase MoaA [Fimbriimonadaceae bacterium]
MHNLVDGFNRRIDYLRVSVTDRCNFRCVYCMPEEGAEVCPTSSLLTFEEMARLARVGASLGITKVRITGGEPLTRRGLVDFVTELGAIGFEDLSLTTNGYGLDQFAPRLAAAGLHRVNVSLDTLREDRFQAIARRGNLEGVMSGIQAALESGLTPVKINCVAMKGVNDDEAAAFAEWTRREPVHVRFIELMPIRWNLDESADVDKELVFRGPSLLATPRGGAMLDDLQMRRMRIDSDVLKASIEAECGQLESASVLTNGPARTYRLAGGVGTVGFISQISNDLCANCNRIRLTSDGFLRPCLMADGELDVRTPLRTGASDDDIAALFETVVRTKPERHYLAEGQKVLARGMSAIGG